jgi:hypothetical protein
MLILSRYNDKNHGGLDPPRVRASKSAIRRWIYASRPTRSEVPSSALCASGAYSHRFSTDTPCTPETDDERTMNKPKEVHRQSTPFGEAHAREGPQSLIGRRDLAHSEFPRAIGVHCAHLAEADSRSPRSLHPSRVAATPPHDAAEQRPGTPHAGHCRARDVSQARACGRRHAERRYQRERA